MCGAPAPTLRAHAAARAISLAWSSRHPSRPSSGSSARRTSPARGARAMISTAGCPFIARTLPGHPSALGPALVSRTAWWRDPQDPHRLEAQRQLLAAVGGGDVQAGQLPHALEPVADRVAVGERAGGGGVHVGVAFQEGGKRAEQVGLVLLVVGDQGTYGLVVEPPQLDRVVHVGQQQLIGAGLLVAELGPLWLALDHIGG